MKKIAKLTSAIAFVAMCVVLICLATASVMGFAETQQTTVVNEEISAFVEELCEYNADGNKSGARQFIIDRFKDITGEDPEELPFSQDQKNYLNIQVKIDGKDTSKQIIIGAHYDTVGAGAGDNVCGVAALYQTLKTLCEHRQELPFNVVFVAFDGEEDGLLGSKHYVNGYDSISTDGMSEEEIASTLVMFNVDSIALGSNLYLMCENKRTDLANLILKGKDPNVIREKPYARGTYNELDISFDYGYYEFVQGSDHTPFRLAGIPIALFFSGSYSYGTWNFNAGDAINTSSDTFANLTKYTFVERILTVSDAITSTVLSEEFVDVAVNARSQLVNLGFWYNYLWPTIVVGVILVALVVATILYSRKLKKKAILGTAEIKSQKVFEKPSAEEIFTFKDSDGKDSGDSVDDIFTFKK